MSTLHIDTCTYYTHIHTLTEVKLIEHPELDCLLIFIMLKNGMSKLLMSLREGIFL